MVSVLNKNKNARLESSSTTVRGHADVAYEQAPLFGRVKRVSRERASKRRSREGPRLSSLAQIGELARRLLQTRIKNRSVIPAGE